MAPIRTALIGLSSSAATSWASGAHLAYLLSPRGREKYTIVALCNSSVDAAKRAVEAFKLPSDTKTFGDPQSVADDPEIDLVVCSTRVDVHYSTILPSVKAGKSAYVEWPLAQDVKHVSELVEASERSGSRSVVGLQGRLAPPVVKLREILRSERIGKVLSSEVRMFGGSNDREILPTGLRYFTDSSVGGNIYTIGYGHMFDQIQYVLGDFQNPQAHLSVQRPLVKIRDNQTNKIVDTMQSNVPDFISVSGSLSESDIASKEAILLTRFRRGQPFKDEPPLIWTINGEKGELRLTALGGTTLHASAYSAPVNIELHDFETDEVEQVSWDWQPWQAELPMIARSIGMIYERFADGNQDGIVSFKDALVRHQQLEGFLSAWESKRETSHSST